MARIDEFRFEGHCDGGESVVELICKTCPSTETVAAGDAQIILDAIGQHVHMSEEDSRPCDRRMRRREEQLALAGRRIF